MVDKHRLLTLFLQLVYALTERNMYVYISMTVIPITPSKNKINSLNTPFTDSHQITTYFYFQGHPKIALIYERHSCLTYRA